MTKTQQREYYIVTIFGNALIELNSIFNESFIPEVGNNFSSIRSNDGTFIIYTVIIKSCIGKQKEFVCIVFYI